MKTITLESFAPDPDGKPQKYVVKQVTDSLSYYPGQTLSPGSAQSLCDSPQWKVTIKPLTR